jgi:hypothetical protein
MPAAVTGGNCGQGQSTIGAEIKELGMNARDTALGVLLARLERRLKVLTTLLGITMSLALASGALSTWQTYLMRKARSEHAFAKRRIEYLEMRLSNKVASDHSRLLLLERQSRTMARALRSPQISTVRLWFSRLERSRSEDRDRIENLENTLRALQDSLQISNGNGRELD